MKVIRLFALHIRFYTHPQWFRGNTQGWQAGVFLKNSLNHCIKFEYLFAVESSDSLVGLSGYIEFYKMK